MSLVGNRTDDYNSHGRTQGNRVELFYSDASGNNLSTGTIAAPLAVDFSDSTSGVGDTAGDYTFQRIGKDFSYTVGASDNPATGAAGTTDASTKITAAVDMIARVTALVSITGVTTEITEISIWKNGAIMASPPSSARIQMVANSLIHEIAITRDLPLVAGDYVEIRLGQTNAGTPACYMARISVERIG